MGFVCFNLHKFKEAMAYLQQALHLYCIEDKELKIAFNKIISSLILGLSGDETSNTLLENGVKALVDYSTAENTKEITEYFELVRFFILKSRTIQEFPIPSPALKTIFNLDKIFNHIDKTKENTLKNLKKTPFFAKDLNYANEQKNIGSPKLKKN